MEKIEIQKQRKYSVVLLALILIFLLCLHYCGNTTGDKIGGLVYGSVYDGEEIPVGPSILLQTTRITPENIHYVIYISVVHSAVQECEKADLVEGAENEYTYRTETVVEEGQDVEIPATGFTSDDVRRELYRVTLMLGDYVFRMLMQMGNSKARITNLTLVPPSAYMQEFPYCSCSLEMDVSYISKPTAVVNTELFDLL